MRHAFQFKVNLKGGIVSPGYLHQLLEPLQEAGVSRVRFGLRQQLLIDAARRDSQKMMTALKAAGIEFEINKDLYPNISSSYPAAGIFIRNTWLSEGVYKDIFGQFDYKPMLKINIADSNQTLMPFFTGHINWIASADNQFWYVYIRFPGTSVLYQWNELIYTSEIARLSNEIEKVIYSEHQCFTGPAAADGNQLNSKVMSQSYFISKPVTEKLELPSFNLPYYEGFNSCGGKLWLGIYRREELFTTGFLKDVCRVCLETKTGELYTTPWKSLIIKNIEEKDRSLWTFILNKHRINVRHASNELNWQIEDSTEAGLVIKKQIICQFEQHDVRTYGLCFAVQTQPESGLYGSVLVRRQFNQIRGKLKPLNKFDILYTSDFNPNSKTYVPFSKNIEKENLATYLMSLCKYFYAQESAGDLLPGSIYPEDKDSGDVPEAEMPVYQCAHCMTIYDEHDGEPEMGIAPGTLFASLPQTYSCPLCDAPKNDFEKKEKKSLGLQTI